MSRFNVVALVLAGALGVSAQEQRASVSILVRTGRLLDVRSGQLLPGQGLLIEGERLRNVGPLEKVQAGAPPDTPVIDLGRFTVLPGLVDCHAHVLGDLEDLSTTQPLRRSSAEQALWGVANLRVWLDHGFTSIRNAGEADPGYAHLALRDAVARGQVEGPRIISAGGFVSVTGGHGDADVLAPDQALLRRPNLADSVEQVAMAVRRDLKYGADWIKLMATGGVSDPFSDFNVQELSEAQMAEAVQVAHRAGRRVMAHAEGSEGIKAAVRAGVDSIEHGTILDDEGARLMVARRTWLVPTLYTFQHGVEVGAARGAEPAVMEKYRAILGFQGPSFQRALKHQVRIAYGLDAEPQLLPRELRALVRGGMKPIDAIRAATLSAAELLGWSDRIGTLEAGKYADLVAVDGDPLQDIGALERVRFVMKGGRVVRDLSR